MLRSQMTPRMQALRPSVCSNQMKAAATSPNITSISCELTAPTDAADIGTVLGGAWTIPPVELLAPVPKATGGGTRVDPTFEVCELLRFSPGTMMVTRPRRLEDEPIWGDKLLQYLSRSSWIVST